jgi:3-hydroxybutyrate dehydrogenase
MNGLWYRRLCSANLLHFLSMNILITGAGSGIGEGIAEGLARQGHHLVVTDYNEAAAKLVAERLQGAELSVYGAQLDVTDQAALNAVEALVSDAGFGPVEVLINNAGLQHVAPLEDFDMDKWGYLVEVMLTGVAGLTRALLPQMRAQAFGRIINIGSIHSLVASPYKSAYVAAKHGLMGFSKVLALETASTDITINTICPTYVRTPLVDQQIAAQAKAHGLSEDEVVETIMLKPMPKGVFISFEELTGICEFLLSPSARNITGQAIVVDGGWTVT